MERLLAHAPLEAAIGRFEMPAYGVVAARGHEKTVNEVESRAAKIAASQNAVQKFAAHEEAVATKAADEAEAKAASQAAAKAPKEVRAMIVGDEAAKAAKAAAVAKKAADKAAVKAAKAAKRLPKEEAGNKAVIAKVATTLRANALCEGAPPSEHAIVDLLRGGVGPETPVLLVEDGV